MSSFQQTALFANPQQQDSMPISRGLIIREPWAGMVVNGTKKGEIRSKPTQIRRPVAVLAGGTDAIIGVCDLQTVIGPLSLAEDTSCRGLTGTDAESSSLLINICLGNS